MMNDTLVCSYRYDGQLFIDLLSINFLSFQLQSLLHPEVSASDLDISIMLLLLNKYKIKLQDFTEPFHKGCHS